MVLALATPAAHAATQVFSLSYASDSVLVPQFDPTLGTLTAASFAFVSHGEFTFFDNTPAPTPGTYAFSAFYSFYYLGRTMDFNVSGSGSTVFGLSPKIVLGAEGVHTGAVPLDRLPFAIGNGTFTATFVVDPPYSLTVTGGSIIPDTVTPEVPSGTLTVTYVYDAAVPEPATWAMMIAGFGMIGRRMRRRGIGSERCFGQAV
jgi:hypothetical protein